MNLFKNVALLALLSCVSLFTFTSCNNNDDDSVDPEVTIPDDALYYFVGIVDGAELSIFVTLTNDNTSYHTNGASIDVQSCTIDYGGLIGNQDDTIKPFFDITLKNYYQGACDDEVDTFNSLFPQEDVAFYDENDPGAKSVIIGFENSAGFFSSEFGDQQSSAFKVTKSTEENNAFGKFQTIEGEVSCRLYNQDNPAESILLENGKFIISLSAYYN